MLRACKFCKYHSIGRDEYWGALHDFCYALGESTNHPIRGKIRNPHFCHTIKGGIAGENPFRGDGSCLYFIPKWWVRIWAWMKRRFC